MMPKPMWWWGWGHRSPAQHWVASGIPMDAEDAGVTAVMLVSMDALPHRRARISFVGLSNERGSGSESSKASFKMPDRAV